MEGVVNEEGKKVSEVQCQAAENCLSKSRMPLSKEEGAACADARVDSHVLSSFRRRVGVRSVLENLFHSVCIIPRGISYLFLYEGRTL